MPSKIKNFHTEVLNLFFQNWHLLCEHIPVYECSYPDSEKKDFFFILKQQIHTRKYLKKYKKKMTEEF